MNLIRERDGLLWFAPPTGTQVTHPNQVDPWTRARQRKANAPFNAVLARLMTGQALAHGPDVERAIAAQQAALQGYYPHGEPGFRYSRVGELRWPWTTWL